MPELTIITINYNNCIGLDKTIQSVLAQNYTDYEYIIIDGGSNDESKNVIDNNSHRITYWVSETDEGVYDAMNKGITKARGQYIMFLNSGDFLVSSNVFTQSIEYMHLHPADIYYGDIIIQDESGESVSKKHNKPLTLEYLEQETINHQASFIRRDLFAELGLYNTNFNLAADHAFYLKAFINGKQFKYINLDMVHYQLDGMSTVHSDKYFSQMKLIAETQIPTFLNELRNENLAHTALMQQRIMKTAGKINNAYQALRRSLKL